MKIFLFSFLLICQGFATSCFAYQVLKSDDSYIFEVYEPFDCIEKAVLDEALVMYYEAYLNPKLHEGISLEALGIDPSTFSSYDNYIADMFYTDF